MRKHGFDLKMLPFVVMKPISSFLEPVNTLNLINMKGGNLNMGVLFWYLEKNYLSSVDCRRVHFRTLDLSLFTRYQNNKAMFK